MTTSLSTFEEIRSAVAALQAPAGENDRATCWVLERRVGIARTYLRQLEIFLAGTLRASMPLVRRHLQHDSWKPLGSEESFEVSRIVLPEGDHFEPISAVLAAELLRRGSIETADGMQRAFTAVEPIIDMALRNQVLSDEWIVGLLGELLVLEQLLIGAAQNSTSLPAIMGSWRGYEKGARDFVLGLVAVEVKTTKTSASRHRISSLSQVEPQQTAHGIEQLKLLSIGLAPGASGGHSVASTTERITALLSAASQAGLRDVFLINLARYGAGGPRGYEHATMQSWPEFRKEYAISFSPRLYDMADPDMKALRSEHLAGLFVDTGEVEYALQLPERINDRNPDRAWQRLLVEALPSA
jgi:hypothetical protein